MLNTLDSQVDLFVLEADGSRTRIDLPIDDATVKEKRGEAFINVGKAISPALRVDAGLNYEYSRLKVTRRRDCGPIVAFPEAQPDGRLEAGGAGTRRCPSGGQWPS